MYPVLTDTLQIRLRMLQTIVNIRHFKNMRWDDMIAVDYIPLYFHAFDELIYWKEHLVLRNFRPFSVPRPGWVCWTDASDVALGACYIEMPIGNNAVPVTVDNVLLNTSLVYSTLHRCASLQTDVYPWSGKDDILARNDLDSKVTNSKEMYICHRNFSPLEQATSSTERELLAIFHVLVSAGEKFCNQTVVIHTDSQNAEIICSKGSPKPKLQSYAKLIHDYLEQCKIMLFVRWIPRDLNLTADYISTHIDYADYEILPEVFVSVCDRLYRYPNVDMFADHMNTKCKVFFSATYCPGSAGVDAFSYDWSVFGLCWIFVAPAIILRVLSYARLCKAHILLLIPQWKNSYFYPVLSQLKNTGACKQVMVFDGKNMFKSGSDRSTYFSEKFAGNVEVCEFNFDY
jgi:RNase H-like domain found in reverse transcriptase